MLILGLLLNDGAMFNALAVILQVSRLNSQYDNKILDSLYSIAFEKFKD